MNKAKNILISLLKTVGAVLLLLALFALAHLVVYFSHKLIGVDATALIATAFVFFLVFLTIHKQ